MKSTFVSLLIVLSGFLSFQTIYASDSQAGFKIHLKNQSGIPVNWQFNSSANSNVSFSCNKTTVSLGNYEVAAIMVYIDTTYSNVLSKYEPNENLYAELPIINGNNVLGKIIICPLILNRVNDCRNCGVYLIYEPSDGYQFKLVNISTEDTINSPFQRLIQGPLYYTPNKTYKGVTKNYSYRRWDLSKNASNEIEVIFEKEKE